MGNEGFFSRLGSLPGKRVDDFMEQTWGNWNWGPDAARRC